MRLRTMKPDARIAARGQRKRKAPRQPQCKACLATGVDLMTSGYCADREACEARQRRLL